MRFTLSWLKKHLITDATPQQISETLTRIGLEVEEMVDKSKIYAPFIIAEILDASPHPNADKLRVCTVYDGKQKLQIVCGASNARTGIKVVLAPIGALIPANNFVIKAAKIRNVESTGMLCSSEELMLSESSDGIIEISKDAAVGSKLIDYLGIGDIIVEIALTPNRGDAACVRGIARDLAAAGLGTLSEINHSAINYTSSYPIVIEDTDNCQEFTATIINGIDNTKPTPQDVCKTLSAIGSKPKSALVDISNFTMLDLGRPNHMYDLDKIDGLIKIRKSKNDEQFIALGELQYTLPEGLLVVADDKKILAIAGVMGGELSKVDANTRNILVEVANFHPEAVAKSGRALNLLSDSRYRFERRIDIGNTDLFLSNVIHLILENVGGIVKCSTKVVGAPINYKESIEFDTTLVSQIAGCDINPDFIKETLTKLGFRMERSAKPMKELAAEVELSMIYNRFTIHIPSYRQGDINQGQDLVEEVLRIYGMDNIPSQPIPLNFENKKAKGVQFINKARHYLSALGYDEMITYSFISHKQANQFKFESTIELSNPISQDMAVMRSSQIPMLLEHANKNLAYGLMDASYFEIGNIFEGVDPEHQKLAISGIITGKHMRKTIFKEERDIDFYDVKAILLALIELYGLDPNKCKISRGTPSYYHSGKSAALSLGKNIIGYVGELNFATLNLEVPTAAFELFVDNLPVIKTKVARNSVDISYLQSVTRDFAFVLNDDVEIGAMLQAINIDDVELINVFDIYKGKGMPDGKKSVAFSITLRPKTSTFTDKQIDDICLSVVTLIQNKYGGVQR